MVPAGVIAQDGWVGPAGTPVSTEEPGDGLELPPGEDDPDPDPNPDPNPDPGTGDPEEDPPEQWLNEDTITVGDGSTGLSLEPGATGTASLGYSVTTPRASTTIHAQLQGAGEGWVLSSPTLADSDPSNTGASWTEASTLGPDGSFALQIHITAPADVAETHSVTLVVWSTATTSAGDVESGVPESHILTATAVAPPVVNTDALHLDGEVVRAAGSGDQVSISLAYEVTTPRHGTTVYAALVDANGETPAGWMLENPAPANYDALTPGSWFTSTWTVTTPAYVEVPHAVSLYVWSVATTDAGDETGVERHAVATIEVAATPAEPVIACEQADDAIACAFDADRADVTGGSMTITGADGWSFTANGVPVTSEDGLALGSLMGDGVFGGELGIVPVFEAGCLDTPRVDTATISIAYTYTHAPEAAAETTVTLDVPQPTPVTPGISTTPLDFGQLTWSNGSWSTAQQTVNIAIPELESDCARLADNWEIRVSMDGMTGADGGFIPAGDITYLGAPRDATSAGIVPVDGPATLSPEGITIASGDSSVDAGASWDVTFELAPGDGVTADAYTGTIVVDIVTTGE